MTFCQRNDDVGRDHATARFLPAQQRFDADHAVALEIELRLVDQEKFLFGQPSRQLLPGGGIGFAGGRYQPALQLHDELRLVQKTEHVEAALLTVVNDAIGDVMVAATDDENAGADLQIGEVLQNIEPGKLA